MTMLLDEARTQVHQEAGRYEQDLYGATSEIVFDSDPKGLIHKGVTTFSAYVAQVEERLQGTLPGVHRDLVQYALEEMTTTLGEVQQMYKDGVPLGIANRIKYAKAFARMESFKGGLELVLNQNFDTTLNGVLTH